MNWNQLQEQVKFILLQQPSIQDCTVLVKKTSEAELIPYIVSNQNLSLKEVQSYLEVIVPEKLLPKTFAIVSHLPFTDAGDIDEIALSKLPVIDCILIEQAETQLKSIPETEKVAAIAQKHSPIIPALHLSDLLSDWQEKSAIITEKQVAANSLSSQNQVATELDNLTSKPLAKVDGGALPENPLTPKTLPEILQTAAAEAQGNGIIYLQADGSEISQSYQELLEEAQRILTGLRKLGLQPQDKVILQLELNQDFIPAFWGCILGGFIPVPVSILQSYEKSHKTVKKLENSWQMLGKPFIFTSAKLAPELDSLWQSLELNNLQLAVIEDLRNCPPDRNWHNPQPLDLAIMLLTSGSTGTPKCISLSHRNLIDRARGTNILCQNTDKDIILNWLPFDHIGSISDWHIRFIYLRCQLIYVTTEYVLSRALNWLDLIHRYRISHSWAPNFAYALVNDALKQTSNLNWNLSCVKSLLTAGEAVSSRAVTEFIANLKPLGLKDKAIHAAFGMAETGSGITYYCSQKDKISPIYTIDKSFLKSTIKMIAPNSINSITFANLGQVIPGVKIRIVNEQNSLLPEETIGQLQVQGNAVFNGYYKNPQANQEVFVEDGWFNTGDLGFITEGHLVITGRAKETIIVNGANYYSHEIEAAVEEITGVENSYTAAIGARRIKDNTDELVIFFSPSQGYTDSSQFLELIKKIRSKLIQDIGINPDYLLPVNQDIIPKTSIGKIQRSQLKQRFESGEFENIIKQVDILLENSNTIPDWFYRKIWLPKKINSFKQDKTQGCTLIFKDDFGLGEYLSQELGSDCIFVVRGDKFHIHNNTCAIDPKNPEHYQQLLNFVLQQEKKVHRILHLWTYEPEESETVTPQSLEATLQKGIYSILFFVQALANLQGSKQEIKLLTVANFSQAI
ncbi:MAG: AMP-binding protein, partial [Cyanobacteria bacterium J06635_10]